ncbi:MAG TPA: NAD-dependent epimerase/dehydratase family protein [Polyangiaceae bacterium]
MTKTVLILGASGKIGRQSAAAFARGGWSVRKHDRLRGNLLEDARGADVIVNGWNPPGYHDWARIIPAITRDVIVAAEASGATVIVPGNVYNFGDQGGEWSESTPQRPNTKKGRIRVEMEQAYAASRARTVVLRGGNFIDPGAQDDVMKLVFLRDIRRDKLMIAGDPEAMQAYCYVPDWATAAVALAEKRAELAAFEDIPFPGHAFTAEELRQRVSVLLGRPITFSRLPWWFFTLVSPFWELAREMREMRYLWSTSHTLSGAKLARLLPDFRPTSLEDVLVAALKPELRHGAVGAHQASLV